MLIISSPKSLLLGEEIRDARFVPERLYPASSSLSWRYSLDAYQSWACSRMSAKLARHVSSPWGHRAPESPCHNAKARHTYVHASSEDRSQNRNKQVMLRSLHLPAKKSQSGQPNWKGKSIYSTIVYCAPMSSVHPFFFFFFFPSVHPFFFRQLLKPKQDFTRGRTSSLAQSLKASPGSLGRRPGQATAHYEVVARVQAHDKGIEPAGPKLQSASRSAPSRTRQSPLSPRYKSDHPWCGKRERNRCGRSSSSSPSKSTGPADPPTRRPAMQRSPEDVVAPPAPAPPLDDEGELRRAEANGTCMHAASRHEKTEISPFR
jgi:hypothetical protein